MEVEVRKKFFFWCDNNLAVNLGAIYFSIFDWLAFISFETSVESHIWINIFMLDRIFMLLNYKWEV